MLLILLLSCGGKAPKTDPVKLFTEARDPKTVREAGIKLGRALSEGCCFGRELEIARMIAERLSLCPSDLNVISGLVAVLNPIAGSVAVQDLQLAKEVFVEIPVRCIEKGSSPVEIYTYMLAGHYYLSFYDRGVFTQALTRLFRALKDDPESLLKLAGTITSNPVFLHNVKEVIPPPDEETLNFMIRSAGKDIYKLIEFFSNLSGRAGTRGLLSIVERKDLPEEVRYTAMLELRRMPVDADDIERIRRLTDDEDTAVADVAREMLEREEWTEGPSIMEEESSHSVPNLIGLLGSDDPYVRINAVLELGKVLERDPRNLEVRRALRKVAEEDRDVQVRAYAWEVLLSVGDDIFNWDRLLEMLRSDQKRNEAFRILSALEKDLAYEFVQGYGATLLEEFLQTAVYGKDPRARYKALEDLNRTVHLFAELSSKGGEAEKFLDYIHRKIEPKVRSLLSDPDPRVRQGAVAFFQTVPAESKTTLEKLLLLTRDENVYVRLSAARALSSLRSAPPGTAELLLKRLREGDPDRDVRKALEEAYAVALCLDPTALDELASVILRRSGSSLMRQTIAKRCSLEESSAISLFERLDGDLVDELISSGEVWNVVQKVIPARIRDRWLLEQASSPELEWSERIRFLGYVENRGSPEIRERLLDFLVEWVRSGEADEDEFLYVFAPMGYEVILRMAEAFIDDKESLSEAWDLVKGAKARADGCRASGYSCGSVPRPGVRDLPKIAKLIRRAKSDTERLGLLVRLLDLYSLGHDMMLPHLAWDAGITPVLLESMQKPGGCEAVRPAIHVLLLRSTPPRCD